MDIWDQEQFRDFRPTNFGTNSKLLIGSELHCTNQLINQLIDVIAARHYGVSKQRTARDSEGRFSLGTDLQVDPAERDAARAWHHLPSSVRTLRFYLIASVE